MHLWAQIVGKVRMASTAPRNHWWHVPLYVDVRGLTTRRMHARGGVAFEIDFDFVDHRLVISTNRGEVESFALVDGLSVAEFDEKLHATLAGLGIDVAIREQPYRVPVTTPFPEDREHASYDRDAVERFWHILEWTDGVLEEFAGWYCGKTSPVHLFWHGLRPRAHPLRRRACAGAAGSRPRRPGDVLARGGLLRLLGGRRERARAELLLVHRPGACRPSSAAVAPWRRPSGASREAARSRSCPTTRFGGPRTRELRSLRSWRARTGRGQVSPAGIRRRSTRPGVRAHRS